MNPPKSREEELFFTALALPLAGRSAYLSSACGDDDTLRGRVELLLRAHEEARSFMETSPADGAAETPTRHTLQPEEKPGETIGRYKLLQKIGEGGCGVVYMAEQQEPVVRRVALKVIKLGMDTKEVIARFEAERQALALMNHPNIASVLDGGATEAGRPFFVMELVRGVPITKFCDEQNLTTAARLELFTAVCHAVQHAHQKGIIHRDLKPSNILVTLHDGKPVSKVIDFGIAKATQGKLTDSTVFTAFEQFIGTPAYMSPEQAEMSGLDIDTRSDIYSLGVLLYELLTGRPPFDPKTLVAAGLDEIRRIIREVEPPKPSTHLSTLDAADRATIAKLRGTDPAKHRVQLSGDLDWIVMKALEKNRARRYETPSEFAADIARHLGNEPVVACPPSTTYRLGKLIRRNKVAFAATLAIAFSLLAGITVSLWQAVRATRAEATAKAQRELVLRSLDAEKVARDETERQKIRAEEERNRAQAEAEVSKVVGDFLSDLLALAQADPKNVPDRDLRTREFLDSAGQNVGERFGRHPLAESAVRQAIGFVYTEIDAGKAVVHLQRALQLRQSALGPEHRHTLASMESLARTYQVTGKLAEAADLHAQTVEIRQRVLGAEHPDTLSSLGFLAQTYQSQGKTVEAAALQARMLEIRKRMLVSGRPDTAQGWWDLAHSAEERRDFDTAEAAARKLVATQRDAGTQTVLGRILVSQRKFVEAETVLRPALTWRNERMPDDWRTDLTRSALGAALAGQRRFSEAEPLQIAGYEGLKKAFTSLPVSNQVRFKESIERLVQLYSAWEKPNQAASWRNRLEDFNRTQASEMSAASTPAR